MAFDAKPNRLCSQCDFKLSRYNAGRRCGSCERNGTPRLPLRAWRDPAVAEALAAWDFGKVLRLLRAAAQLSQREMAQLCGIGQATLSELESGCRRLTHIDKIISLLKRLEVPSELTPIPVPGGRSRSDSDQTEVTWDSPFHIAQRRGSTFMSNTNPVALDLLFGQVQGLVNRYEREGAMRLAPEALDLRSVLQELIEGQQPARLRRRVFYLAAQASGLLAYMAVNAGRSAVAEAYCEEAVELAQEADAPSIAMWALGTRSLAAYYDRRYGEALEWANAGVDIDPHNPQAIRLQVNGRARALGQLGDHRGVDRAVGAAEELSGRHHVPEGLTSCISFEPYGLARTLANAATAYVPLNDTEKVVRYAGKINRHIEEVDSPWSYALVNLDVATALLVGRNPDAEQAMSIGHQVLDDDGGPPIFSVVQRATDLAVHARPFESLAVVQDYRDTLSAWRTTPDTRALVGSATMTRHIRTPGRTAEGAPPRRSPHISADTPDQ
ncbi:helix-turn-helix domain-containing protein [Streptomyces sp. NPDC058653]|uniref:helix-turn-helix domain-containing protein n=1 Tax=Streptomyces sp. NPDC058653 TaxID=3346576 RepID=UPI00364D2E05